MSLNHIYIIVYQCILDTIRIIMNFLGSIHSSKHIYLPIIIPAKLDIPFNNSLADNSENNNTSATSAGVTYTTTLPAVGTHSAVFASVSATKAFVQYTNVLADVSTAMTISLWLKVTGVVDTTASVYFDVGTSTTINRVYLSRAGNQAYDATRAVDKNYSLCGSSPFALRDNTWHHLVFVVTKNSSTIPWYRNGVAQTALTGANTANYPSTTSSIDTVRIGSSISSADKGLIGQVDQFRIYPAALSSAAQAGYVGSINDMNLYYTFNSLSNNTFLNQTTLHTTADVVSLQFGGTLDTTVFKFGPGSLKNNNGTTARNMTTNYILPVGSHSFSFWVYLNPTMAGGINRYLMGWATDELYNINFGLRISESSGPYTVWAYSDRTTGFEAKKVTTEGTTLAANTWHHLVAIFNTTGSCTLYLNNVQQQTVTFAQAMNTTTARKFRDFLGSPGSGSVDANQDDFRHYERALSADEINTLYNA